MKKIKFFVFLVFVFVSVPIISVTAQVETQEIETTLETVEAVETNTVEDKSTGRSERLESYKSKVSNKLAEAQAKRIAVRCKTAQVKITSYRKSANVMLENRTRVYAGIIEKLDALLAKMQKAELNTQTLETARDDMRADLLILETSFDNYDTVLSDLEAMDCESDPDSFNTALIESRNLQSSLKTKVQEFRQFSTTQIKEILQDLKQQLENKVEQP